MTRLASLILLLTTLMTTGGNRPSVAVQENPEVGGNPAPKALAPTGKNAPSDAASAATRLTGEGLIALCLKDADGRLQIFTIHPDGTGRKQLTTEGQNGIPIWSRDGKKLAFASIRKDHAWVAVMEADGSGQKLLAEGVAPDWSPDGRKIAFSAPDGQIWVMNADGSEKKQATQNGTNKVRPSWSHDGKRMAFVLVRNPRDAKDPQPQIGIVNADGSEEGILTKEKRENVRIGPEGKKTVLETAYDANAPSWSPVDDRVAFWSGIENRYGQIWVIRADGTGSKQLTDDPSHRNSDDPSWSPDGKKILFSTGRSGRNELWVMNADGSDPKRLSDIDAGPFPGRASWQPVQKKREAEGKKEQTKNAAETKYLTFQLMTIPGVTVPVAFAANPPSAPTKAQMEAFVRELVKAIGTTGDARHKLGFTPTHLRFDESDEETRRLIHDAFVVARENDVAVAFHLDDSMYWGKRKDLLSNPDNIETADWKQIPSTGRRVDWGPKPSKFVPQMCFNSPDIQTAVKKRAALIGAEVKKELDALKTSGKEYLFAGVIAGSETQMGRDFDTDRALGYRALKNRGFSEKNPPNDLDAERVSVVKEFMELWANSLHAAGTPREKVFCHIAFTDQGLRKADAKESYAEKVHFAQPEVAFSSAYRPGFSTYPEGRTFKEIYAVLEKHDSPGWISAEGTNVSPTTMPGEPTMETYLGRVFNHGGVLVNVFSWGMGGEANRNNFFRRATENPEALGAYAKFLRGEKLVESTSGFSSEAFQTKMRRIQTELPDWVKKSGKQEQAMPLVQKMQALTKEKKWQEVDKVADEILALISSGEKK